MNHKSYFNGLIRSSPKLHTLDINSLAILAQLGDTRAADKLCRGLTSLVLSFCHKKANQCKNVEYHELFSPGLEGVLAAIKNYNPNKSTKFTSYASIWIISYMDRFIYQESLIKLPIGGAIANSLSKYTTRYKKSNSVLDFCKWIMDIEDEDVTHDDKILMCYMFNSRRDSQISDDKFESIAYIDDKDEEEEYD